MAEESLKDGVSLKGGETPVNILDLVAWVD